MTTLPTKDPDDVDVYYVVWCDATGKNDGLAGDNGELQGETISTTAWTVASGLTKDADAKAAITIQGTVYPVDTVASITLSGGTDGTSYTCANKITTSGSRTLTKTVTIPVAER